MGNTICGQSVVPVQYIHCGTLAKHNTQKENVVKTLIERIKKTTKRLNTLTILNRHTSFFPFGFLLHFSFTATLKGEN